VQPPLLGAVDQEQPTEGPPRLTAEGLLALLLDEHHRASRVGELGGRHQTGQASADDQHVAVHPHQTLRPRSTHRTTAHKRNGDQASHAPPRHARP